MIEEREKHRTLETIEKYLTEFEALSNEIKALAFPEKPSWNIENCCLYALSNVNITPNEVIITADLPNVELNTVKVEVTDGNLIKITAKMKKKMKFKDFGIFHRNGEFSSLSCIDRVNETIDSNKLEISYKNGILEVRIPKK
ncbi:Hsp20/alpha crystallin family protein [Candidatus Bathyarchaeota archaeon]|nr:Hsp20/alpha crystallin family protein [Candidatus Bathyarchaeota archaeon]